MRFELTTPGLQEQSSTTALFLQRKISRKIVIKSLTQGSWVRILLKPNNFHLEIWFLENFYRGPYFVGFQTKWIMTPYGTYFNAVALFLMFFIFIRFLLNSLWAAQSGFSKPSLPFQHSLRFFPCYTKCPFSRLTLLYRSFKGAATIHILLNVQYDKKCCPKCIEIIDRG